MRRVVALAASLLVTVTVSTAAPREVVERFGAAIEIGADGVIDVTETLEIRVEGDEIRRGIIRDLPLVHGEGGRVGYDVVAVARNGTAEPFAVEREGQRLRIRVGAADTLLPAPSVQRYTIRYRSAGQLRRLADYDELYWNVTGNAWTLPIRRAAVAITLPEPLPIVQFAGYTGPLGARGRAFEILAVEPGFFRARTTEPLPPGEGFTVAIAWPAGAIANVGPLRGPEISGLPALVPTLGAAIAATLALGLALWCRYGRDPRAGAPYPRFTPPTGVSPAAARYLQRRRFDARTFTACLVSLAVKGALRITDRGPERSPRFTLDALSPGHDLSRGERAVRKALFAAGPTVELGGRGPGSRRVDEARRALSTALEREFRDAAFVHNRGLARVGLAVGLLLAALALIIPYRNEPEALVLYLFALLLATLATFMATQIVRDARQQGRKRRGLFGVAPLVLAIAAPTLMLGEDGASLYGGGGVEAGTIIASGLTLGLLLGVFRSAMAAPTVAGRRLLDEVAGLELYLAIAEADRLESLHPPDRTPARFEALLPYAIALDLVSSWTAQFTGALTPREPDWYRGGRLDPTALGDRLDRDLARAAADTTAREAGGGAGRGGGGSSSDW